MYQFRGWFCDIKDFKLHIKKKRKKKEITHEQFYAMCQLVGKNTFLNA